MSTSLYEILGLTKAASPAEVRKSYRNKARDTHPDRLPRGVSAEEVQTANERFRLVNHAYEILTNATHRKLYDLYGVWPPPAGASAATSDSVPNPSQPTPGHYGDETRTDSLPPLTEQDRVKFMQMFEGSGAQHGFLDSHRAFELLQKSNLQIDTLKNIWDLADREQRGYLDAPAFTIAMYLVQICMSSKATTLPSSLPQRIYDEAAKTVSRAPIPSDSIADNWTMSPSDKAAFSNYFDAIEHERKGYVEAEVAATFFHQSGLSDSVLAQIWDLVDVDNDGRLTREEFAVAMCLTRCKLAGKEIPAQLPPSLLPARTLWS
ncbi:EF-hand protein [Phanerochaete sordida]|uniref:EF-hand protein n=1 Tax=Phanerochaete sordida TaxID=48140 RepID=A0A9P3G361_9APHY|nr:EF-hand protein [Phanerochaete sordida]